VKKPQEIFHLVSTLINIGQSAPQLAIVTTPNCIVMLWCLMLIMVLS